MTLSDFSIKRPVFAWILMFGLIFFGTLSFQKMGINENPDVEFPVITISYQYEGATPAVIEKDVIEPVESILVSMQGIRNISSTASRGNARIQLEFDLNKNVDFALQEVNTLLSRAQRQLPDILNPPVVTKSNADDQPIMYLNISKGNLSERQLMVLFRDRVQDRLSTVDGVAEVRAFGYHEPMMRIDLDAEKLRQFQLTAQDVVDSIAREHQELPAGKFELGEKEDLIRVMGEVSNVEEFQNIVISRRGGTPNYNPQKLKDVAKIYEGIENLRRLSRVNGNPAMSMSIQKQRGVNAVAVADRVKVRMEEINNELPKGTQLSVNFDMTMFIRDSVNELVFTLLLSAFLTSLVCWLFIGSLSAAVNVMLAIPTAIVGTFIFINWMGFTLNTFSLLGLALAIGIVVDDAIVMLENIIRYVQSGFDRVNASFKGAREISFAVIATSVALVSIFLPISFMPGMEGRFFFEFAVTISIAVALSSLEALTLAPMRCSQFLKLPERTTKLGKTFDRGLIRMTERYGILLKSTLKRPWMILSISLAVFLGSLVSIKYLSFEISPPQDRSVLFLLFLAPDGKSMDYTLDKVKKFEKIAAGHPDVENVITAVGGFGFGGQSNRGNGVLTLRPFGDRKKNQFEIAAEIREQTKNIDGIQVIIRDRFGSALGGRRGSPLEFTISGPDSEKQKEYFLKFKEKMDNDKRIVGARSDDVTTLPELHIVPNRMKAQSHGVEVAEISKVINTTFGGVVTGQYTTGGRRFDIFVQLQEGDRRSERDIKKILVRNNRGEMIPLNLVVDIEQTNGPQSIFREDRARGIRVDSSLANGVKSGDVIDTINIWAKEILPKDYYLKFSDTPKSKLMETLIVMVLGLIVAYMILASQFNSFWDPWFIFLAIPFAVTGALIALVMGGQSINIYSIIGIFLTMGIVKKNSILLVEFFNQLRDQGVDFVEAIEQACKIRLRPILMTNLSTVAAAVPPALSFGPGAETRVPMALTVIGGVSISVLFTLFVVPSAYKIFAPKRVKILEEVSGEGISHI